MADLQSHWLGRLDDVESRLGRLAEVRAVGLTSPDSPTGEQWDVGQVWAHLAEFGDYWLAELLLVLAGSGDVPVPFGRVKSDDGRISAIEAGRNRPVAAQLATVRRSIGRLRRLLTSLTPADWMKAGRHQTLGVMDVATQLQHFHVGHYEEHADQLSELVAR